MRVLLLGSTGQVGSELARTLAPVADVIAPARAHCNAADLDSVAAAFRAARPDPALHVPA